MDEFNNRINAQRRVLSVINSNVVTEPLFGLSRKAIERWLNENHVLHTEMIASKLFEVAAELAFLATKSQQQVTEEYRRISVRVNQLVDDLEAFQKK